MEFNEKSYFSKNELKLPIDIGDRFIKFYQDKDFIVIKKLTTLERSGSDLVNAQVEKLVELNKENRKSLSIRYLELEKEFDDLLLRLNALRRIVESLSDDALNKYKIFNSEFIDSLYEEINAFHVQVYEHKNNAQLATVENNSEDEKERTLDELSMDVASFKEVNDSIKEKLKEKFNKFDPDDISLDMDQDLIESIKDNNFEKFWKYYEKAGERLEYLYKGLDELDTEMDKKVINQKDQENRRQVFNYFVFNRHKLGETKIDSKDIKMTPPIIIELGVPTKIVGRFAENIFKISNSLTSSATFDFPEYIKKVIMDDFNSTYN